MNDRYLFKAKRKNWQKFPKEQWVYGYYVRGFNVYEEPIHIILDPTTVFDKNKTDGWDEIDPTTLCQCTSLKDKNGNLVWENDVVRQFADCDEMGNDLYFFYQIKYDEKCARFYGHEIYVKENELFDELDDIEVMGNIFDNPELLEVE